MHYVKRIHIIILILFFGIYLFGSISSSKAQVKESIFSETEEKLGTISEKEQKVLQELFFILQDIEEMERQQVEIQEEIKRIKKEVQYVSRHIEEEEIIYERRRNTLKEILKIYQKRG